MNAPIQAALLSRRPGRSYTGLIWGLPHTREGPAAFPLGGNDFVQDCESPHPRNASHQGGPELIQFLGELLNDSVPRTKPEATCNYFFTLEMK